MSVGRPDWYASTKRRPFISVYPGSVMLGEYVASYNPEQRVWREAKILRGVGLKPAYRVNIRFHDHGNDWLRRRAAEKQLRLHDETLAQARAEGRIE